jgi:hypothetical protein
MKNSQFDIDFSSNMHTNIMKLEFLHDLETLSITKEKDKITLEKNKVFPNETSKVKNKKFYDLIKQKII